MAGKFKSEVAKNQTQRLIRTPMELGTRPHRDSPADDLEQWIAAQAKRSAAAMELAVSATHLVRRRDQFGQVIVPARGSVLASVAIGDWNPEPDYFFHWVRDSAMVMRTIAELSQAASTAEERSRRQAQFEDFVRFSLKLTKAAGNYDGDFVGKTQLADRKFLRSESELRSLRGDRLLGEPRFNPDGSLDVLQWSRPQYDGPALRALACLRFIATGTAVTDELRELLRIDLDFTVRHAGQRCVGPWEEKSAQYYYVGLVQLGALVHGGQWTKKDTTTVKRDLYKTLEDHWSEQHHVFSATAPIDLKANRESLLDGSFLLAVLDADLLSGPHSAADLRVHATQQAIEETFANTFEINRTAFRGRAPALGRYANDMYFGGGAWLPTTIAAANLYYRRAHFDLKARRELVEMGDSFLNTVRDLTPADGSLPEQVDSVTGNPTSARHLTWSNSAFVSAALARFGLTKPNG